ncbi:MAG: hypothetical protein ACFFD4_12815 [Candidatus Odinarchaeota archaeon]
MVEEFTVCKKGPVFASVCQIWLEKEKQKRRIHSMILQSCIYNFLKVYIRNLQPSAFQEGNTAAMAEAIVFVDNQPILCNKCPLSSCQGCWCLNFQHVKRFSASVTP